MYGFSSKQRKIGLARTIGEGIARSLFNSKELEPRYIDRSDRIDILNFAYPDDSGYYMTGDFIELPPTNKTYNLFARSHKKIYVNPDALDCPERKQVIENTIRIVLTKNNQASEMSRVKILNDGTLLVSSDDWSNGY